MYVCDVCVEGLEDIVYGILCLVDDLRYSCNVIGYCVCGVAGAVET